MLESARSQDTRDTPRSSRSLGYGSPRDERFYTPRTVARENSASNSDEWQTPRYESPRFETPRYETPRYGSDGEFQTPRMFESDRKGDIGRLNALRRSGSFKDEAASAAASAGAGSKMMPPRGRLSRENSRSYSNEQQLYSSQAKGSGGLGAYDGSGTASIKEVDPYDYDADSKYSPTGTTVGPRSGLDPSPSNYTNYGEGGGAYLASHYLQQDQQQPVLQEGQEGVELEDEVDYIALDLAAAGLSENDVEDVFSYARHGRLEEIERLFAKGLPVDVRDAYGNTVLTIACQNGNKRVAKAVLRRGANINARNHKGNTPLHYCYHCE